MSLTLLPENRAWAVLEDGMSKVWVWLFPPGMCCFCLGSFRQKTASFTTTGFVLDLEKKKKEKLQLLEIMKSNA